MRSEGLQKKEHFTRLVKITLCKAGLYFKRNSHARGLMFSFLHKKYILILVCVANGVYHFSITIGFGYVEPGYLLAKPFSDWFNTW
ncbi:hypothetical protein FKM82_027584 [Ascaphus truei]